MIPPMGLEWLRKLERNYGDLCIERFAWLLVGLKVFGFILLKGNPSGYKQLMFIPHKVMEGELWRLVGFICIPYSTNELWLFFELYLLFIFVDSLEKEWGAFKINVYYLISFSLSTAYMLATGYGIGSPYYLDSTLMLAFAALNPSFQLLLFFIIPIKIKWLAWLLWLQLTYAFIVSPLGFKVYLALILANYFLFFGPFHYKNIKMALESWHRRKKFKSSMEQGETDKEL